MEYTIPITGIERHKVTLQEDGPFSKPRLLVDGQPAQPGPKVNLYRLPMDDHTDAVAWVKRGVFDPSPIVTVGEEEIGIAEPFTWWQWLWIAFPLLFLLMQNRALSGIMVGTLALFFNGRIMRMTTLKPKMRYLLTIAIFFAAFAIANTLAYLISKGY